jgi:uncharacterized protein YecT (DUF1311 family)
VDLVLIRLRGGAVTSLQLIASVLFVGGVMFVFGGQSGASGSDPLKAPVITETFTHLPCNHGTTVGLEGCAEGRLLSTDRQLNEQVKLLFDLLPNTQRKRSFVAVEDEWFAYRKTDCATVAAIFHGGTIAPVEYAQCEVRDDRSRSADLHSFFSLLEEGNSNSPRWP